MIDILIMMIISSVLVSTSYHKIKCNEVGEDKNDNDISNYR